MKHLKNDILMITALLLVSVIVYAVIQLVVKKDGGYVHIKVDGVRVHTLSLHEDKTIEVQGYNGGYNIVTVKDGKVYVEGADCPDSLCVHMGTISKTGETIVCLPHRVVVEVVNAGKEEMDGYAK